MGLSTIYPRVIVLIHNPVFVTHGNRKLSGILGWHDPNALVRRYIKDVAESSHGIVQYQIMEHYEVNGFPRLIDGYSYTQDSFLKCWRSQSGFHKPDGADYLRLMNSIDFMQKVQNNLVDELWLLAFPYAGYYESAMGGKGAFWCNAPPLAGTEHIGRRFVVMGFNYERDVDCMLENLGHRAESIMESVFRSSSRAANLWEQFTRFDKTTPGKSACGNVHFAPNSDHDYEWGNRRLVASACDNWMSYPTLSGAPRQVNCSEWGNGDMRAHHMWWMKHFPHTDGVSPTSHSNNWWEYILLLAAE